MMVNTNDLLPLELWLYNKQSLKNKFPGRSDQYFARYLAIKKWLEENVYRYIGAGTSAEDGGIYTDHGPDHFNAVINYAGKLVGVDEDERTINIEPYEVFLLLSSILLHDAGNIHGRIEHEKKPLDILNAMGALATSDRFERKIIADIAEVHGGKTKQGDKDTIGNKKWDDRRNYLDVNYRPNMIAALVRFADEICEDRKRAAMHLIETNSLPKESEVFHQYAYAINSVVVDRQDKSIKLEFYIEEKNICKKFGKQEEEVYLIDEIMLRLGKMNDERIYCSRFFHEIIQLQQIRATVIIIDEDGEELKKEEFKLKDSGYPSNTFLLTEEYPDWVGEKLKETISSRRTIL
ncbi:HD domain-containing protein [Methylobacter sp. sgz302048]|uniref:HD domain-containing protein n=1 Tax=Methylobacter sp. sgz302048 TaxID=3455945 RepID=UPI003FA098FE